MLEGFKAQITAITRALMPNTAKSLTLGTSPSRPQLFSLLFKPQASVQYHVDDPLENSAVAAVVRWAARTFPEAPPIMYKEKSDGQLIPQPQHPLSRLMRRPNPVYSGTVLQMGVMVSWILDGNAYIHIVRNKITDLPVQLWYWPHWSVEPIADDKQFISGYKYQPKQGESQTIPVKDVIHLRDGIDPDNPIKGLSAIKSLLKEIFTDEEATNFAAALLKNMGVPGAIISSDSDEEGIDPDTAEAVKTKYKERLTGGHRGEPLVIDAKVKVTTFGFTPQQMNLTELHRLPEERLSAVIGIPAAVVGLGAGLDRSTYSNLEQARQIAYENFIIPTQRLHSEEYSLKLVPAFEPEKAELFSVGYDLTKVRVLQPDYDAIGNRLQQAVAAGVARVSEYRAAIGLPVEPEHEIFLRDPAKLVVFDPDNEPEPNPREEEAAMLARAKAKLESNVYTLNEVREELGLIPIDGGDTILALLQPAGGAQDPNAQGAQGTSVDGVPLRDDGSPILNMVDLEDSAQAAEDDQISSTEDDPNSPENQAAAAADTANNSAAGDTGQAAQPQTPLKGVIIPLNAQRGSESLREASQGIGLKEAPKKGPGSRGGKFWIDKNGKVRYGAPPAGTKQRTARQWLAYNRRNARAELKGITTGDEIQAAGWEDTGSVAGASDTWGKDSASKAAAIDFMTQQAKAHPEIMYVTMKVDGKYTVVGKPLSEIKEAPPAPKSAPAPVDQLNIGSAKKPKVTPNGPGPNDPQEGASIGDVNAGSDSKPAKSLEGVQVKALSESEYEALANITDGDIEAAQKEWRENAPQEFSALLDAKASAEKAQYQDPFTWDSAQRRYRDAKGKFVPQKEVLNALNSALEKSRAALTSHTEALNSGNISLSEWEKRTARAIKSVHLYNAALAQGGWSQMSAAEFGGLGTRLKQQYKYLREFAIELAKGALSPEKALARVAMYGAAGRATYHSYEVAREKKAGVKRARRVLGSASTTCSECKDIAARGWVAIEDLPPIGMQQCLSNCHCEIEFSKE